MKDKLIEGMSLSWKGFGGAQVVKTDRVFSVCGNEDSFGYLVGSQSFWLMPGVYELKYDLELKAGRISIGLQDEAGKKWFALKNDIDEDNGEFVFIVVWPRKFTIVFANCNDGKDKKNSFFIRTLTIAAQKRNWIRFVQELSVAIKKRWRLNFLPLFNKVRLAFSRITGAFLSSKGHLFLDQVIDGGYAMRSISLHEEIGETYLISADVGDDTISVYPLKKGRLSKRRTIPFSRRSAPMSLKPVCVREGEDVTLVCLFNFDAGGQFTSDSVVLELANVRNSFASEDSMRLVEDCSVVLKRKGCWGFRGLALVQQGVGEYIVAAVDRNKDVLTLLEGMPVDGVLCHSSRAIDLPRNTEPIGIAPYDVEGFERPAFAMTSRKGKSLVMVWADETIEKIHLGDRSRSSVAVGCFRSRDRTELAVALWGGDPTMLNEYGIGSLAIIDPIASKAEQVVRIAGGVHPTDVACGDIDGDGLDEIVLLNYGVGLGPADRSHMGSVMIFKYVEDEFKCIQEIKLPNPRIAFIADLDGDGRDEVVVSLFFEKKLVVLKLK